MMYKKGVMWCVFGVFLLGCSKREPGERGMTLIYPDRINVPADIPSTDHIPVNIDGEELRLVFPTAMYCSGHYDGWQQCLDELVRTRDVHSVKWVPPIMPRHEGYTVRGMEDGFNACRSAAMKMLEDRPSVDIYTNAMEVFEPRNSPEVPPARPKGVKIAPPNAPRSTPGSL